MEAQRYPDDYDGIVAGAPANYWIGLMTAELWAGLATTRDPEQDLPRAKLPVLGAAVMAACDGLDGLEDGLIDDPRNCDFDPGVLLCDGADAGDCLTAGQVAAARAIYAGPVRPSTGESLFPGYALGSEHFEAPDGLGGWARYWSGITEPGGSTAQFMKYSVFEDPDYDLTRFDFDADWDRANNRPLGNDETLASALNAIDPDLSAFRARGGKLISYHGWADALITGHYAVDYYENVLAAMGGLEETTDFYRLFMAPGVAHCRGGPGPDRFDAVEAIERWVERGEAPDRDHRVEGGGRRGAPFTPALRLSAGGPLRRQRQHRRRGELRLRQSGLTGRRLARTRCRCGTRRKGGGRRSSRVSPPAHLDRARRCDRSTSRARPESRRGRPGARLARPESRRARSGSPYGPPLGNRAGSPGDHRSARSSSTRSPRPSRRWLQPPVRR